MRPEEVDFRTVYEENGGATEIKECGELVLLQMQIVNEGVERQLALRASGRGGCRIKGGS